MTKGFLQPSNSPYGAPCFFVKKPHSDGLRLVVDWRNLNNITIKDKTQLPNIADLLATLTKARFFSLLDGHSGFWQVRIREGDEHKTAFRTPFGNYEWRVMGMGLTNAPATYQRMMNDILRPHLRESVLVYLDDVLVFSETLPEHLKHLRQVLSLLRLNNVKCKPSKCILAAREVLFLGHVVGHGAIKVDPEKVSKVTGMKSPECKADVRTFLGMCEYLASHLVNFAEVATPLTELTRKHRVFEWSTECEQAFQQLKKMVSTAPVLMMADPSKPFILASDASDFAGSAVLLQEDNNNVRHPVSFFSRKFTASEFKWSTRDKECRAMLDAINHWNYYLKGRFFSVETDHHSLKYLRTQKDVSKLSLRQERLLDDLANFNFKVHHIPGKLNAGADGLSRLAELHALDHIVATVVGDQDLLKTIALSYNDDGFFKRIKERLASPSKPGTADRWRMDHQGLLWLRDLVSDAPRLGVPQGGNLRLTIMQEAHDTRLTNHQGVDASLRNVHAGFFWPRMAKEVESFVRSCELCQRARTKIGSKNQSLLHPLDIPQARWQHIAMDFKTSLPPSDGFTAIIVVVDRLTKEAKFIKTHDNATAQQTAKLFFDNVICSEGLPLSIVSDRDPKFTSEFWQHLFKSLGTKLRLSTADHPQTDGQSERTIRTLKERLTTMVNHGQTDWASLLPAAQFQYNTAVHSSIGMSPFEAVRGRTARLPLVTLTLQTQINPDTRSFLDKMETNLTAMQDAILLAQDSQQSLADKGNHQEQFEVGEEVLVRVDALHTNSIQEDRRRTFGLKYDGPFRIIKLVGQNSATLDLPGFKVHHTVNFDKIIKYAANAIPGREDQPPAPVQGPLGEERFVLQVLGQKRARGRPRQGKPKRFQYLVHWAGERQDQSSWEPEENLYDDDGTICEALQAYLDKDVTQERV